jgi:adenosylmethionine-8-amino-7-oxononanoate aminotransferase
MTLAATLCSEDVAQGVCQGEPGVFMHGPTFMGNALACSVANASLKIIQQNAWQTQVS